MFCLSVFEHATIAQIPLYVTPIYNYAPLSINTPDYQKELLSLNSANCDSIGLVFKSRLDSVSIESLFIYAIRLYDLGKKDESVFWFHTAKLRAGIFSKSLDLEKIGGIGSKPFELKQAFIAFSQLAGEYINGYAGGDVDKWIATLKEIKTTVDSLTVFVQYQDIAFVGQEDFQKAKENRLADYDNLLAYLAENKKEIKKARKKNGIEGKY